MMKTKVHGGNLWSAAQKYGLDPEGFIDFSASINPLGPSPKAIEAIERHLHMIRHYPTPTGEELKPILGAYLGIDAENLVLGNGGTELIYLLGRMYGTQRILLLAPCFSEYGQGPNSPEVIRIPIHVKDHYTLPVEQIINTLREGDLLFLGNPNNPTARLFAEEDLLEVHASVKAKNAHLVIDEAFFDFTGQPSALRQMACREDGLTMLGSLTKFFALPGLRIGYAIAKRDAIEKMEMFLPPWRLNSLALWAAEASLQDKAYIKRTQIVIPVLRTAFIQALKEIGGLQVYESDTNFLLLNTCRIKVSAEDLQARLGPEGLLIRTCNDYHGLSPYHFRLAVRSHEENQKMLASLKKLLV